MASVHLRKMFLIECRDFIIIIIIIVITIIIIIIIFFSLDFESISYIWELPHFEHLGGAEPAPR